MATAINSPSLRASREGMAIPRILIVDDHPFIRRGIKSSLEEIPGCDVCGQAENGQEGIRLALALKPDVILLDISMPDINGIEAAKIIRQSDSRVKIVLLTLHNSGALVRSAFSAGVNGYLLKEDAEAELIRALSTVLGDGTYLSPGLDPALLKNSGGKSSNSLGT